MPATAQSAEIVKLDLSAGSVHTVMVDGMPQVVLKPAIEELGLDFRTQLRKLKTRSWAVVGERPTTGADGKTYDMKIVPQRTFLMLLATINENNVDPAKRPVLIAFQNETADAIEAYWTRGEATNPRAFTGEPEHPTTVSWEQAAAIARIQYGLDVDTSDLRELLSKGGILKHTLAPHKRWEHLFWPLANRWEIHAAVLPQLIRFAAKVRRELAAAEQDLQMSLPLPITGLLSEGGGVHRPPAVGASVFQLPRPRGGAS